MRIQQIFEAVAEDYFRKIDALDAMIADKSTTPGEKDNARTLKSRIEQKLHKEFPNATKPEPSVEDDPEIQMYRRWADEFARQQAEYDRYENAKKPGADRHFIRDKIEQLKAQRKEALIQQAWGNVEAREEVKELSARIDRLYSEYFPEEWAQIQAKREANNERAAERSHIKRKEKVATMKAAADESGLSFSAAAKGHEELLKKLYRLVTGEEFKSKRYGSTWRIETLIFHKLQEIGTKELRSAFAQLTSEEQTTLRNMIKSIHTVGHIGYSYDIETDNGYTEAQKQKVLKGMDILKQADGLTFKDFENKYNPILKGFAYKPSAWGSGGEPVENPVEAMGKSGNTKAMREYVLGWIQKLMNDQQRAEMLADTKRVNPSTPQEERTVFGWKSLLTPEGQDTGISWDSFKQKYADTIESTKYKRDKWEKGESLFDIFGKAPNSKWHENDIRGAISKLTAEQKSELLSGLAEITPKNATELARIKRLKGYFE